MFYGGDTVKGAGRVLPQEAHVGASATADENVTVSMREDRRADTGDQTS
jgi:hypothetical protein